MEQIISVENKHDKALEHFNGIKPAVLTYIGLVKDLGNLQILQDSENLILGMFMVLGMWLIPLYQE